MNKLRIFVPPVLMPPRRQVQLVLNWTNKIVQMRERWHFMWDARNPQTITGPLPNWINRGLDYLHYSRVIFPTLALIGWAIGGHLSLFDWIEWVRNWFRDIFFLLVLAWGIRRFYQAWKPRREIDALCLGAVGATSPPAPILPP
jgi:hypothetical protein